MDSPSITSRSSEVEGLRQLWNTLKKMRYGSPQPKFCPKCMGHNIRINSLPGILPPTYKCLDCGYEGCLVFEIEPEEDIQ